MFFWEVGFLSTGQIQRLLHNELQQARVCQALREKSFLELEMLLALLMLTSPWSTTHDSSSLIHDAWQVIHRVG
jgi:hypothetical protein